MGNIQLVQLDNNQREKALNKLGYGVDEEGFVVDEEGNSIFCKYSEKKVHINNAAILPGSHLIINANPLTMAEYFLDKENEDE